MADGRIVRVRRWQGDVLADHGLVAGFQRAGHLQQQVADAVLLSAGIHALGRNRRQHLQRADAHPRAVLDFLQIRRRRAGFLRHRGDQAAQLHQRRAQLHHGLLALALIRKTPFDLGVDGRAGA
ncbi:hypothetical protein D3C81_1658430 [compost metagenome]